MDRDAADRDEAEMSDRQRKARGGAVTETHTEARKWTRDQKKSRSEKMDERPEEELKGRESPERNT